MILVIPLCAHGLEQVDGVAVSDNQVGPVGVDVCCHSKNVVIIRGSPKVCNVLPGVFPFWGVGNGKQYAFLKDPPQMFLIWVWINTY